MIETQEFSLRSFSELLFNNFITINKFDFLLTLQEEDR